MLTKQEQLVVLYYYFSALLIFGSITAVILVKKRYNRLLSLQNTGVEAKGKVVDYWDDNNGKGKYPSIFVEFKAVDGIVVKGKTSVTCSLFEMPPEHVIGTETNVLYLGEKPSINIMKNYLQTKIAEQKHMLWLTVIFPILTFFILGFVGYALHRIGILKY